MKQLTIIGVLAIFMLGVLAISLVVYKSWQNEVKQLESQVTTLQSQLKQSRESSDGWYRLFVSADDKYSEALNQTAAVALKYQTENEELRKQSSVVYKFPNTPPYTVFPDPIDFDQALLLLTGMRASHEAALNWTFTTSPGFGIDDKEFQLQVIEWYDSLIDYTWRHK